LEDDAGKFHVKFGILLVHFLPTSTHRTCFLPNHTWSLVWCHTHSNTQFRNKHSTNISMPADQYFKNTTKTSKSCEIRTCSAANFEY